MVFFAAFFAIAEPVLLSSLFYCRACFTVEPVLQMYSRADNCRSSSSVCLPKFAGGGAYALGALKPSERYRAIAPHMMQKAGSEVLVVGSFKT